jgi:uncharacterized protein YdeI (YjbR/CyaY-like superfamily)
MQTDPRIDAYIDKAQPFAQPILRHLRKLVHQACPQVEETMKWSFPHFDYKGELMCSMAAFKQHAVFGFWKAALMKDPSLRETAKSEVAMGHLGRITALNDLPADHQLLAWIKEAMTLNDLGVKVEKKPVEKKEVLVPDFLMEALRRHPKAMARFDTWPPSHRKEYVEWIADAKTEATREKRIGQAMEWIAEGKGRNWKYEKK